MTTRATTTPLIDVQAIRADFPALHQEINGHPLAYLDNAATTHKPRQVIEAIAQHDSHDNANVHRGIHTLSQRATDAFEHARETVQRSLGATRSSEIVFTRGTTEAINLVAHGTSQQLGPGDEVLITELEHHSNIVPWQMACQRTGATLRIAPIQDDGSLDLTAFERSLSEATQLVAISHVSNALGTINPVRELTQLAHEVGAQVLIDGAQAVPHTPVDVQAIGCEYYAFSGHKVYGPTGIGALYGQHDALDQLPPYQGGGEMIRRVRFDETTYADLPARLEAGTPNITGAIGLAAALDYVDAIGLAPIQAHENRLVEEATEGLEAIDGVRVIGTAPEKASVVSFVLDGVHPHDVGTVLDREGVAIRAGHHCAQPVMEHFAIPATCRASFALYNTAGEVDALLQAVQATKEVFS